MSHISTYISQIQREFDTQQSTEHSFRPALKTLLESLNPNITALNESQRITGVGMPDFTIKDSKNNTINLGRIEAKDLYIDLDEKRNKDQLGRYLAAFDNFIYTNNLAFKFYRDGKLVETVSLGTATKSHISRQTTDLFADNITKLERLLTDFLAYEGQTITSSEKLARAMAQKAQLIKYAIQTIFADDALDAQAENSSLYHQYTTFKQNLIHDLTVDQFADMYAQTIAYGLFAARLYDPTLPTFSRAEAETLIPKTTPFVRRLFKQMANDDEFDERIAHIIDDLVAIFLHCDVAELLQDYNRETGRDDPIIHFYETFLGEYDSKMRKKRGVYYTPEPVVKFIVRGVDHLLKTEFGLSMGLADTSTIEHTYTTNQLNTDKRSKDIYQKVKKTIHRVQVLDPATGTGTFLDETIKYIHRTYFATQAGIWKQYVTKDLLPRIRGFEILMASYTMAHLKMGLTIQETLESGVRSPLDKGGQGDLKQPNIPKAERFDQRFNIYLTNSLEEPHDTIGSLFSQALAKESEQASKVKKEQPIMVVMGNPPYAVSSSNKGEWIQNLIADYKKDLNEKKLNLDDDYVKFIRYAEYFVEKNNEGILGFITNNTYIDGVTFRQMRKHLMQTFDTIYIVDLHGNSKKKETSPDGSKDENVFDIQQGVSIIFGIKKTGSKKLATVYHTDIYGDRMSKYEQLNSLHIGSFHPPEKLALTGEKVITREKLAPVEPYYFFVPKDFSAMKKYEEGIKVDDLFINQSMGILTSRDNFVIDNDKGELKKRIIDFCNKELSNLEFQQKYSLGENYQWKIGEQRKLVGSFDEDLIKKIDYRLFDTRYIYFQENIVFRMREEIMNNLIVGKNLALNLVKRGRKKESPNYFVTNKITDKGVLSSLDNSNSFPLYLYSTDLTGAQIRTPNLDPDIIADICKKYNATRLADHHMVGGSNPPLPDIRMTPVDVFDYIYAVLHSPTYRETYKEFLKIDFPRVPFVQEWEKFQRLAYIGSELRSLHLMESIEMSDISALGVGYPVDGDNTVGRIGKSSRVKSPQPPLSRGRDETQADIQPSALASDTSTGHIYINDTQHFAGVPQIARDFYIGGYQPAQKWLKDRTGRTLSYDDIIHYQKIIVALIETARLMCEVDKVGVL